MTFRGSFLIYTSFLSVFPGESSALGHILLISTSEVPSHADVGIWLPGPELVLTRHKAGGFYYLIEATADPFPTVLL